MIGSNLGEGVTEKLRYDKRRTLPYGWLRPCTKGRDAKSDKKKEKRV
jgi:hypothetical protein